nr:TPA_asm: ND6 [Gammarus pulex]
MAMTLSLLSTYLSTLFITAHTPLIMAFLVIAQAITVVVSIYLISTTSWFSFILILIFVSAMMIIFVYVSSLASNEFIYLNTPIMSILTLTTAIWAVMLIMTLTLMNPYNFSYLDMSDTALGSIAIYNLYTSFVLYISIMLIVYLLITLIATAKIALSMKAPLRVTSN